MKERTGRHSAPGYALRSVAAEERGRKSTLNREVFSLDNPGHLIDPKVSYIEARGESQFVKEGIADYIRCLITTDIVANEVFGISNSDLEKLRDSFYLNRRQWLRRQALDSLLETRIYEQNGITDSEFGALNHQYMGVDDSDSSVWMTDLIFTTHPVYLHNYLFGEYLRDGLVNYFASRQIASLSESAGSYLAQEFFAPAGSVPWYTKTADIANTVDDYYFFVERLSKDIQSARSK
ncbi:hypothetical protein CSA37_02135 [Candidatus Fermentibacteria bacterium]|nr:MAG: hypothetical protein CSA37_02135 [Candidatus Fermentibacteria bacterium]